MYLHILSTRLFWKRKMSNLLKMKVNNFTLKLCALLALFVHPKLCINYFPLCVFMLARWWLDGVLVTSKSAPAAPLICLPLTKMFWINTHISWGVKRHNMVPLEALYDRDGYQATNNLYAHFCANIIPDDDHTFFLRLREPFGTIKNIICIYMRTQSKYHYVYIRR